MVFEALMLGTHVDLWRADGGPGIIPPPTWPDSISSPFPFHHCCQWVPTMENDGIEWDEGEKFYDYVEWLQWLQDNVFNNWGLQLEGELWYLGEAQEM